MKKIVFIGIVIVSLLVIKNLSFSIYNLWGKKDLIILAQKELEEEEQRNRKLRKQLEIAEKDSFVEQEARNKLFLVQPGENIIVLPNATASSEKNVLNSSSKKNWQLWLALFFKPAKNQ